MDEETEKRDEFIYELIADRFRLEWQRTNDLDGKASRIVRFVGIIVSLQAGLGSLLLKELPRTCGFYFYPLLCFIFLSELGFLMCSILCGLKAYGVKTWSVVPDTEHLIEEYAKKDKSRIDILRLVSAEISAAVAKNAATNDEKVEFIRQGFIFFVLGIGVAILFVCGLLLV